MAIVYKHTRVDNNEVFYIGIGKSIKRAYSKHNRNQYWKNITNKSDYNVSIIFNDISWKEACKLEQNLIQEYGRKDLNLGTLVNMTDGGEGVLGHRHEVTNETREKISQKLKGKYVSKETRLKLSIANKGNTNCKGRIITEEIRKKISRSNLGRNKKGKKIIDTETGIIYNSISIVANIFNIKNRTLAGYLDGSRKNKTNFKYYIEE